MKRNRSTMLIVAAAALIVVIVAIALFAAGDDDITAATTTSLTTSTSEALPSTTSNAIDLRFDLLSDLDGIYVGEWDSGSLGAGSASLNIDVDATAETVTVAFDLEGQLLQALITEIAATDGDVDVMGGVNAVFSEAGTASGTGTLVGDYSMSLTSGGEVALAANDVPGPHVDAIDVAGTLEPDCFTLEYRITFEGTDTVIEGSIELCRTDDGGIIIDNGGTVAPTQTIAEYTVEVLDQSGVDPVGGTGMATSSVIFECADGRCGGTFSVGQIAYPDGTAQRGGSREFKYDEATATYSFDETFPGACQQERWYGTITPTDFDDRGPTGFTFAGGHDGSGGCDYELVYTMTATRVSVVP